MKTNVNTRCTLVAQGIAAPVGCCMQPCPSKTTRASRKSSRSANKTNHHHHHYSPLNAQSVRTRTVFQPSIITVKYPSTMKHAAPQCQIFSRSLELSSAESSRANYTVKSMSVGATSHALARPQSDLTYITAAILDSRTVPERV